ncbi:MAG TPA: hypothetical protein VHL79_00915 [Ramlibacter sp.]|nr:hypothetical protein [Ramlibacter sp.]
MQAQELKKRIDGIEDVVDQAKNALQSGNVPQQLREKVEALHQQARQVKHSGTQDENALKQSLLQLEKTADQAKDALKQAGNVDPKLQQAVQRAHDELSQLKKQVEAGSPA